MGNLAKDTTEVDLWAFDEIQPLEDEEPEKASKGPGPGVPAARPSKKPSDKRKPGEGDPAAPGGTAAAKAAADSIKVNVGKTRPVSQSGTITGQSKPGSDFDDLDHWEDVETESPASAAELVPMPVKLELAPVLQPEPDTVSEVEATPPPEAVATDDEFSVPVKPNVAPVSLRPNLGLSKIERLGLFSLVGLLVVGGIVLYYNAIHGLQSGSKRVVKNDFPIPGKHLAIRSAESYWRAPVTAGGVQDTVRRGTVLIPEVLLKPEGGPAAIRVFFRNSDGDLVGDAVTRSVQTAADIRVAATAGFEDIGMHAAYRTGQSKPWTVEVREAPSENSPVQDFKKLFEMDISTDRR